MNKELYVVDEHGEIIDKIEGNDRYVKLSEGDKIVRKGVLHYLSDTTDVKYKFVKVNPISYSIMAIKYPMLNILINYLGFMDNILTFKNGRYVKMKDIPKICNVSESTAKRQIKGMLEDDVLHKIYDKKNRQTYLVLNPWIAYVGKKIYLSLYEEFKLSAHRNRCEE